MLAYVEGLVDQLEDRRLCKAEALGSNPNKSTRQIQPYNISTKNCQEIALIISQDEPLNRLTLKGSLLNAV